ncbi:MAG TPA: condensation domain-containing protein, partial [Cytophagales bacterium]
MTVLALLTKLKNRRVEIRKEGNELKLKAEKGNITPELLSEIKAYKPQLLELFQSAEAGNRAIPAAPSAESYPLTYQQKGIWLLCQNEQAANAYNIPFTIVVGKNIPLDVLNQAIGDVLARHEVFRTSFFQHGDGTLRQQVREVDFRMEEIDASGLGDEQVERIRFEESMTPFNLAEAPLLRATLLRRNGHDSMLLITVHHIVFDGLSAEILRHELLVACEARRKGAAPALTTLPNAYKDYAVWQYNLLAGPGLEKEKTYWQHQLAGELPVLQLVPDNRPALKSSAGKHLDLVLPAGLRERLEQFSVGQRVSPFAVLLAGLNALFHRYTASPEVLIGAVASGRDHHSLQSLIGMFINTLPIRTPIAPDQPFVELVRLQQQVWDDALAHQQLPFGYLVELLNKRRDVSRSAIFDVVAIYNDERNGKAGSHPAGDDLKFIRQDLRETSQYDVTFSFVHADDRLALQVEYNSDLYSRSFVEGLLGHYQQLLAAAVAQPEVALGRLD